VPFFKAYRIDLIGLAIGSALTVTLIGLVWALVSFG